MASARRVLIVGVGSIGERHLRCFLATNRATVAVCEVDPTLRAAVAERHGIQSAFERLEDALAERPEAAVIATPAHLHVPMTTAALEAGLHVLVEKPLSTSCDGVDAVAKTAAARGLIVRVAYVHRLHPALAAMRRALLSGQFGAPLQLVATCGQNFPTYRPAYREIYYREHATGGGAVQDALTHILDMGQWLVGPIDQLAADLGQLALDGVQVEDTAHLIARHGPVMGCYSLNQHQAPNEATVTVVCQRGTARFEGHNRRWRWMAEPGGEWHDEAFPNVERDTPFVTQAEAFLDAIEGRPCPLCSVAEALHTVRAHLAIFESSAGRRWCPVPPDQQAFLFSNAATRQVAPDTPRG